jgi:hemerythrin
MGTSTRHRGKMEWQESYSVGVEELDAQHRRIMELINEIAEQSEKPQSKATCFVVLNAMIKYAETHFSTEEAYLEKHGYPKYPKQQEEHEKFVDEVFNMTQELDGENPLTLRMLAIYLQDWYAEHILGFDQEYKVFLSKKLTEEAAAAEAAAKGAPSPSSDE